MKKATHALPSRKINWDELRQRLARTIAAMEDAVRLSPEQAKAVLDERARVLARAPVQAPDAARVLEVAKFTLANEQYALETRFISRVVRLIEHTPVPGAPDFLVGLINLQGDILAVFDLRKFFGLEARGITDLSMVFVLGGDRAEFGVLVDAAKEVMTLEIDEVLEPPGSVTGAAREYLRGVTKDALMVLDGAAILKDPHLFIEETLDPAL
ncbi:MAG TPA: chemotaxis protein CheW [Gemmataceae bacterium]|nr:chemotaxis protein CheW [Gemmataceae bacterium]